MIRFVILWNDGGNLNMFEHLKAFVFFCGMLTPGFRDVVASYCTRVCETDVQIVDSKTGGFVPNYLFSSLCSVFWHLFVSSKGGCVLKKKVTLTATRWSYIIIWPVHRQS